MKKVVKHKLKGIPTMSIGFVRGEALMSKLIRWWARYVEDSSSDVNHVFIYIGGGHKIAESIMRGNVIRRLNKYLNRRYKVYIYSKPGLTQEQIHLMKDFLYEKALGRKYDFRGLLRFVFKRIPQDPNKNYCSEMAIELHRAGNNFIPEGLSPSVLQDYVNQERWNLTFQHNT